MSFLRTDGSDVSKNLTFLARKWRFSIDNTGQPVLQSITMATKKKPATTVPSVTSTPEETLRTKIADIHNQTDALNLSRFDPPLAGELLAEYESLSAAGTTKPSEWAEFYIRATRVRAGMVAPTAPGETGSAPLTRPPQRNESKWQQ